MLTLDTLQEIDQQLQVRLRRAYDRLAVKKNAMERQQAFQSVRTELVRQVEENEQAKIVLQAIEQVQHVQLKEKVEGLVTFALRTIFEREIKFEVEFDARGHQAEARFRVRDERDNALSIRTAHGGGLLVVASFVLRVVVLLSIRPALRPLIVMDEPFGHVSEQYREKLIEFVRNMAESAGLQFLLVTHLQDLAAIGDKRYRFRLVDGVTVVGEIAV